MKTNMFEQHNEHTEWLKKLSFFADEFTIMQKRLEEISAKNNGAEILKEIEHFQNQFIIQRRSLDELSRRIKSGEKQLMSSISDNPIASDHRKAEDHAVEREQMESLEKVFNELRKEFASFLSKRM